jgi:hypothetical protein
MKKISVILLLLLVLGGAPCMAQTHFAASINPLPALAFAYGGGGIGASFEAAPLSFLSAKLSFTYLAADMLKIHTSKVLTTQDADMFTFGLNVRYYLQKNYLGGFFAGIQTAYLAASMDVEGKTGVPAALPPYGPPASVPRTFSGTEEFKAILMGPELGYKFVWPRNPYPWRHRLGLFLDTSAGYTFKMDIDGSYDSYMDRVPEDYRFYTNFLFGNGLTVNLSMGISF